MSGLDRPSAGPGPSVDTAVLTWDDLLDVWDDAAADPAAADDEEIRGDLRQLRALCDAMAALDVAPLGLVATGAGERHEREADLQRLVAEATAGFRLGDGKLLPLGPEPGFGYYRRYIPGGLADPENYCAVGVVVAGPEAQGTPFWLRYHRESSYGGASFTQVVRRFQSSRFAADLRGDGGHLWLPLRVSADRGGAAVVAELIEQIEAIRAVAASAESA
jgi:hypothetical protein